MKRSSSSDNPWSDSRGPPSVLHSTLRGRWGCFRCFLGSLVMCSGKSSRLKPSSSVVHIRSNTSLCQRPTSCRPSRYVMIPGPKRSSAWYRPCRWGEEILLNYLLYNKSKHIVNELWEMWNLKGWAVWENLHSISFFSVQIKVSCVFGSIRPGIHAFAMPIILKKWTFIKLNKTWKKFGVKVASTLWWLQLERGAIKIIQNNFEKIK